MTNSFHRVFQLVQRHPKKALLGALMFLGLSVWCIAQITFNEDITRVIPRGNSDMVATDIAGQMSFTDKISVIFLKKEDGTDEDLIEAAQSFMDTLSHFGQYYHNVQGVMDEDLFQKSFQFVHNHLPIYLDSSDYSLIESTLTPDSIRSQVRENLESLTGSGASFLKDVIVHDPLQLSLLALKKLQHFQNTGNHVFKEGFLFSQDGHKLLLFINPRYGGAETKHNEAFVDILQSIQSHIAAENPSMEILYFGAPIIAVANAKQIKHDIMTTVAVSVSLLMLLLVFYYRSWLVPVIVMIPSVFGGLFGLLCLFFLKSDISAISLSISAILIGITIDYALHFLTHSKNTHDKKRLFKDVSKPLLMSSSTTAVAFLCLLFVRSEALVDLGVFASISVVATAVFTLIILPHLYKGKPIQHVHTIDRIASYPFEKNKILIAVSFILIIISAFTYHNVRFDGDLSKINFVPNDQKEAERALHDNEEISKKLFVAVYGANQQEASLLNEQIAQQLDKYAAVDHVQSLSSLIPSEQSQREAIARWKDFWNDERVRYTIQRIEKESTEAGFVAETHTPFYESLRRTYTSIDIDSLKGFDEQLYREFVHGTSDHIILSSVVSLQPKDRDSFVQSFEKNNQGKQVQIIDRQALNEQYLGLLISDFNTLVSYSFAAVLLILFVFYRRIELVIVASIPIALTGFITAGLMGFLDIPFNIFSTIVCTLIFGHGIDFTIFMTSALQKQYTYGKNEMPLYRTSIILAVLTTILAIGALVLAKHPALKSIALIALIGVSVAVLVTFVLYPILYKFFFFNRIKKGVSPVSLYLLVQSIFLFAYFALASVVLSVILRGIFWVLPIPKLQKWRIFSKWMSWYMASVLYLKPQVSKRIFHRDNLKIAPQAVFIANHTSFLDTLSMGMLNPNIIFVVNDWVYDSPVFGKAVKYLGFFPASLGIDSQLEKLRERIGKSFSIVVFPEGTRSATSEIHRFHKGAFYMAEQLNLPIQPLYIHGNADSLPKGDFIIYDNYSHIHVDEPIFPNDQRFGADYHQRAKAIGRYFRDKFKNIRLKAEKADYFKQKLFFNYLYKEYRIGRTVKKDFARNKAVYHELFHLLDEKANIAHITTDMGQIDFLLLHQFPTRKVRTLNLIEEHRDISKSSYINQRFRIVYADNIDALWQKSDVLILSHLKQFEHEIPDHITQIIVICCSFDTSFSGFDPIRIDDKLKVYHRHEAR